MGHPERAMGADELNAHLTAAAESLAIENELQAAEIARLREENEALAEQRDRVVRLNEVLQEANEAEYRLARTDALTKVGNRRGFDEELARRQALANREHTFYYVDHFDLEDFKQYNVKVGDPGGDRALRSFANALKEVYQRTTDQVFRLGGDEFGVIRAGSEPPQHQIRELKELLRDPAFQPDGEPIGFHASSVQGEPEWEIEDLLTKLGLASVAAKKRDHARSVTMDG